MRWFNSYTIRLHILLNILNVNVLYHTIWHYNDVIMGAIASQITSLTIVYATVYSDADQRKHQSSASLAFVRGIHRAPVNSPHKWPVTRKMFPFDDVIMKCFFTVTHILMLSGDICYDMGVHFWQCWQKVIWIGLNWILDDRLLHMLYLCIQKAYIIIAHYDVSTASLCRLICQYQISNVCQIHFVKRGKSTRGVIISKQNK